MTALTRGRRCQHMVLLHERPVPATSSSGLLDGRVYAVLRRFTDQVLLGLAWLLASAPVVTIGPATAAAFGVARARARIGSSPPLVATFAGHFRSNCRRALFVQLWWLVAVAGFAANLWISGLVPSAVAIALQGAGTLAVAVVAAASVYAFPLMVTYDVPARRLISTSTLLALGRPKITLGCLALVALAGWLAYTVPLVVPPVVGLLVETVHDRCARVFDEVGREADGPPPGPDARVPSPVRTTP